MQNITRILNKGKVFAVLSFAVLSMAASFGVPAPANAATTPPLATTCRTFAATTGFVGGGRTSSQLATVPNKYVSKCVDINVRNIKDPSNPQDTCATFRVVMYPKSGAEPIYTAPKYACSAGAKGPIIPIATNVINGTSYRVLYNWEYIGQHHDYQIID